MRACSANNTYLGKYMHFFWLVQLEKSVGTFIIICMDMNQ